MRLLSSGKCRKAFGEGEMVYWILLKHPLPDVISCYRDQEPKALPWSLPGCAIGMYCKEIFPSWIFIRIRKYHHTYENC